MEKHLNFVDEGAGPKTFVWVHGWGGSSQSLLPLHNLAKQNNRSILVDLYGFGKSDMPDKDWGVYEWGDNLKAVLDSLNLSNTVYFGHSFGGAIGVYLASAYPNLFSKLILCAPSYKRDTKPFSPRSIVWYKIRKYLYPLRYVYYKIRYPNSEALKYPKLESNFAVIMKQDLSSKAAAIKTPTLLLWGDQDKSVPVEDGESLNTLIPDSTLRVFNGYTHSLPLVEPEMVYEEINKWLQ